MEQRQEQHNEAIKASMRQEMMGMYGRDDLGAHEQAELSKIADGLAGFLFIAGLQSIDDYDPERDLARVCKSMKEEEIDLFIGLLDRLEYLVTKGEVLEVEGVIDDKEYKIPIPELSEENVDKVEVFDVRGTPVVLSRTESIKGKVYAPEIIEGLSGNDKIVAEFEEKDGHLYCVVWDDESRQFTWVKDFVKEIGPKTDSEEGRAKKIHLGKQIVFANDSTHEIYDEYGKRYVKDRAFLAVKSFCQYKQGFLFVGVTKEGAAIYNEKGECLSDQCVIINDLIIEGDLFFYYGSREGDAHQKLFGKDGVVSEKKIRSADSYGGKLVYWEKEDLGANTLLHKEIGKGYSKIGTPLSVDDKLVFPAMNNRQGVLVSENGEEVLLEGEYGHVRSLCVSDGVGYYLARGKNKDNKITTIIFDHQGNRIGKEFLDTEIKHIYKLGDEVVIYYAADNVRHILETESGHIHTISDREIPEPFQIGEHFVYTEHRFGRSSVFLSATEQRGRIPLCSHEEVYSVQQIDEQRFYVMAREGGEIVKKVFNINED
jgi:hypothetical protein